MPLPPGRQTTTIFMRTHSMLDRMISGVEHALLTSLSPAGTPKAPSPASAVAEAALDEPQRQHSAGLMRINHAGEVCAQALYLGQAAVGRSQAIKTQLLEAASEEADHLAWCARRLEELGSQPSILNPFWYAGSFAIGAIAGLAGDRISLGFIVETERQVEAHLGDHLVRLPAPDERSRAIVGRMQADEARHGENAQLAGAATLPLPITRMMFAAAGVMKALAYRI